MSILSANQAQENLHKIIDQTSESHEPIFITGKKNNAVLISEDDWYAIIGSVGETRRTPRSDDEATLSYRSGLWRY